MTIADDWERPIDVEAASDQALIVQWTLILLGAAGWLTAAWTAQIAWPLALCMCGLTAVIELWGFKAYQFWERALGSVGVAAPFAYWTLVIFGCSAWTIFSILHAIPLIAGTDLGWLDGLTVIAAIVCVLFLAGTIPFHKWAIDRVARAQRKPLKRAEPERPDEQPTGGSRRRPRRSSGRPMLTLVRDATLATLLTQAGLTPRDAAGFERAALLARDHPDLTQEQIAERAGVTRQTLGRWKQKVPQAFAQAA